VADVIALSLPHAMTRSRIVLVQLLMKLSLRLTMKAPTMHPRKGESEGPATWPEAGMTRRSLRPAARSGPLGRAPRRRAGDALVGPGAPRPGRVCVDPVTWRIPARARYDTGPTVAPVGPASTTRPHSAASEQEIQQMVSHHHTSQHAQPSILTFPSVRRHRGRRRVHRRAGPSCRLW
jgi:hypothetical protein